MAGELPYDMSLQPGADIPALKAAIFERYLPMEQWEAPASDALTNELLDFLTAVRHGRAPRVTGETGWAALKTADAVCAAVANHRWDGQRSDSRSGAFALLPQTSETQRRAA